MSERIKEVNDGNFEQVVLQSEVPVLVDFWAAWLSWDRPVLKDPSEGDIIDYYGSCDHDPLGKDEIQSQRGQQADQYDSE